MTINKSQSSDRLRKIRKSEKKENICRFITIQNFEGLCLKSMSWVRLDQKIKKAVIKSRINDTKNDQK